MAGNVREWVADSYDPTYYRAVRHATPPGPPAGTQVVLRGGSWLSSAPHARTSERAGVPPERRNETSAYAVCRRHEGQRRAARGGGVDAPAAEELSWPSPCVSASCQAVRQALTPPPSSQARPDRGASRLRHPITPPMRSGPWPATRSP